MCSPISVHRSNTYISDLTFLYSYLLMTEPKTLSLHLYSVNVSTSVCLACLRHVDVCAVASRNMVALPASMA